MAIDLSKLPEDIREAISRGTRYIEPDRVLEALTEVEAYYAYLKTCMSSDAALTLAPASIRALDAIRAASDEESESDAAAVGRMITKMPNGWWLWHQASRWRVMDGDKFTGKGNTPKAALEAAGLGDEVAHE